MATEENSILSKEEIKDEGKAVTDRLEQKLKDDGYMKTDDFNKLAESVKEVTIMEMINHAPHNDSNCGICNMKKSIDGNAYKRGLVSGVKLGKKYPKMEV